MACLLAWVSQMEKEYLGRRLFETFQDGDTSGTCR